LCSVVLPQAVLYDHRLVHRGTPNASAEGTKRPMLYLMYSKPWFREVQNFDDSERLLDEPDGYEEEEGHDHGIENAHHTANHKERPEGPGPGGNDVDEVEEQKSRMTKKKKKKKKKKDKTEAKKNKKRRKRKRGEAELTQSVNHDIDTDAVSGIHVGEVGAALLARSSADSVSVGGSPVQPTALASLFG
jgi:hypothetical protein